MLLVQKKLRRLEDLYWRMRLVETKAKHFLSSRLITLELNLVDQRGNWMFEIHHCRDKWNGRKLSTRSMILDKKNTAYWDGKCMYFII